MSYEIFLILKLRSAIPGGWQQIVSTKSMQRSVNQNIEYNIQLRNTVKVITKVTTKDIYWHLMNKNHVRLQPVAKGN